MSGERVDVGQWLRDGTAVAVNLGMGFTIVVPTTRPEYPAERGPGREGTLPTRPKAKPVHAGYPEPNSHKLDPREYEPVAFPERVRLAREPKKPSRFTIVRNT